MQKGCLMKTRESKKSVLNSRWNCWSSSLTKHKIRFVTKVVTKKKTRTKCLAKFGQYCVSKNLSRNSSFFLLVKKISNSIVRKSEL